MCDGRLDLLGSAIVGGWGRGYFWLSMGEVVVVAGGGRFGELNRDLKEPELRALPGPSGP